MKSKIITKLPGPRSGKILDKLKKLNIAYMHPYPFVHSSEGAGCYFKDIDGNTFLDFASQIASNPLGYNNPELKQVAKFHSRFPIKYAGQDFTVRGQLDLLEELLSITPKKLNAAFLVNSGAEAVENCLKLAMRKQKKAKFGIAFKGAFHGRTLGALSCTKSKPIQKKNFLAIPIKHISFNETAINELRKILKRVSSPSEIGFVIIEPIQGEGGYNIAPKKLMKDVRKFTKTHGIPFIVDEIQSGMGRTGKWWAFQHYNVEPDIISAAKALQVGAAIANRKLQPEPGTISSTWGGGHIIDLALGLKTIRIIKKRKLLNNITKMGSYALKRLIELNNPKMQNIRGKGLMIAFDLPSKKIRNDFIIECAKRGLVLLGCGTKGVRLIPPYIVSKEEIDIAVNIIDNAVKETIKPGFKHTGKICNYLTCGEMHT